MKETLPLITIITPVFNAASCIEKCIQSIVSQTYTDIEHLIMDGQSTDNTITIVQQYQEAYPQRIKLISERDNGIYDAMNKGIKIARGRWLFFLGADDFLYENAVLEKVSTTLINTQKDIVYGNVWMEKINAIYDGVFDTEKLLKHNFCHQAVFYAASVFATMDLYNLSYKIEADYDFNLRCWLSGKISFEYIPDIVAFHASGGVSTERRDAVFVKDYPALIMKYILQGQHNSSKKIDLLSKVYRKLLLRYSINDILKYTFNNSNVVCKLMALAWMPFAFLLKKKTASIH